MILFEAPTLCLFLIFGKTVIGFPMMDWFTMDDDDEENEDEDHKSTNTESKIGENSDESKQEAGVKKDQGNTVVEVNTVKTSSSSSTANGSGTVKRTSSSSSTKYGTGAAQPTGVLSYFARTLGGGVRGLKNVVDGSTSMTRSGIKTLGSYHDAVIDSMQETVDSTSKGATDKLDAWGKQLDVMRRSMSGTVRENADKSNRFTITTSSGAPLQTINGLLSKYVTPMMSEGGGSSNNEPIPLPEITSFEVSNFSLM